VDKPYFLLKSREDKKHCLHACYGIYKYSQSGDIAVTAQLIPGSMPSQHLQMNNLT
jgi:hypothetical protein